MKSIELTKLRSSSAEELETLVLEKRKELDISVIERTSGKEKNIKLSKNIRRDIAQLLTLIKEKEIVEEMNKDKVKEVKK